MNQAAQLQAAQLQAAQLQAAQLQAAQLTVKAIETLRVRGQADIYAAIQLGRAMAGEIGFEHIDQTRIETIIAELARNALVHGGGGVITLRRLESNGLTEDELLPESQPPKPPGAQLGLEIVVEDYGPGIADLAQALAGGRSTAGGLGVGISAVRRLADEFAVDSVPGLGTRVRVCKWLRVTRLTA